MKKNIFFVYFILLFNKILAKETIEGYYITMNNDTIKTSFLIPFDPIYERISFWKIQEGITYVDSTNKKQHLSPAKSKGFVLFYVLDTIQFISKLVDLRLLPFTLVEDNTYLFLRLEKNGYHKLFKYYGRSENAGGGTYAGGMYIPTGSKSTDENFDYCLQKGNEIIIALGMLSKKDFYQYYSDYPELSKKIQNKEYQKKDILTIVEEYNFWYNSHSH